MRTVVVILCLALFTGCSSQTSSIISTNGKTIETRFNLPPGFIREDDLSSSFDDFLRTLPLKPAGTKVVTYRGTIKYPDDVYEAVVDMDIGKKDLQQCADAVMRLRAEYLFSKKLFNQIHFNFTNGMKAEYIKYAEGYRYSVKNNTWVKTAAKDASYEGFRNYLDLVFNYAGSLSLSREMIPVNDIGDIKPGDVFIKGGSPGHAVIVADVAINKKNGKKLFMIAQSYMPAQNIHVLKNMNSADSPWYSTDFGGQLKTPEWTFGKNELMRFKEN